jgi:hypothetical protein
MAGWSVEKVRRYEGPILAEREHVARLARDVHRRRRGGSVALGAEVARRLTARGVDPDQVRWDSWRVEGDPWTIVVTFPAGGRERSARWHLDLTGRSVTPGDDEARWLSEDQPEGEGPLAGARLSAVSLSPAGTPGSGHVYDVEVDGGIGASDTGTWSSSSGEALDLVGAMRARRQAGRSSRRRPASHGSTVGAHDEHGDALSTGVHPAGRRRSPVAAPEPLELDPSLMNDPPSAHPPAAAAPDPTGHAGPVGHSRQPSPVTPLPTPSPTSAFGLPEAPADPAPGAIPPSTAPPSGAHHWPLADVMRHAKAPAADAPLEPATPAEPEPAAGGAQEPGSVDEVELRDHDPERRTRPAASRRPKRPSVPSWDDIMFGAKQD